MNVTAIRAHRLAPTMTTPSTAFDSDGRLSALLARVRQFARNAKPDALATAPILIEIEQAISDRIHALQGAVLGNALLWNDEDTAFARWACEATRTLADVVSQVALRAEPFCTGDEHARLLQRLIVLALANRGDAIKWETITQGQPANTSESNTHALYRLAERIGQAHAVEALQRGGITHGMTVEAHYLRVLLLPMTSHGVLNRQQIEIADSWLWTWTPSYRLTRSNEKGEPGLWVDLAADYGLRTSHFAPDGRDVRFIIIGALRGQIAEVIGGLQSGHIYPGFGCSAQFRVEEHIAVVDHLQRMWERAQHQNSRRRSERTRREAARIEGYVGLGEFLERGYARAGSVDPGSAPADPMANLFEIPRRWFRVNDESEHGLGLLADENQWEQLELGDLIGVKGAGEAFPIVGVAVRKLPARGERGCLIGVELLGRDPRRVSLTASDPHSKTAHKRFDCLYLPGKDPAGSLDSLLVSQDVFAGKTSFEMALGQQTYVIELNRMRRQGRGWVVAGFEVINVVEQGADVPVAH